MLNTLKYVALSLVRDKGLLIWALAFPIVLSTCFMFMFSGLDNTSTIEPIKIAVVTDENWEEANAFQTFMDAVSEDEAKADHSNTGDDETDSVLFHVVEVATPDEGEALINDTANDDHAAIAYLTVDEDGLPFAHVKQVSSETGIDSINIAILVMTMDMFVSKSDLAFEVIDENPQLLADENFTESLFEIPDLTERIEVTQNAPKESVRYFFALLGMAALFGATSGLIATLRLLPNMGPLGARRELSATSHIRALIGTMLASWLVSFSCLLIAYVYMRVVIGIDFAGRDGGCVLAIAVSSLMATSLGVCLGSIPGKGNQGAKVGILTAIVCICALFAGLYGQPTMRLADAVEQTTPWASWINPAKQISDAFYSLMYYDTLDPLLGHLGILLIMTVILFAISAVFLRRQRYASL